MDWALANKDICQKKYYECRPYHVGETRMSMDLPSTVGYNHRNTVEYNWGLYGDSNERLKELVGGKKAFEQMGIAYDSALCRLLVYTPGNILPWHYDTLNGWCRDFAHLNPDMETGRCDEGEIVRWLLMVSDWHWGHVIQMANSFFPKWKSGEVYDIPRNVYHLSANVGITVKSTMNISGVKLD